MLSHEFTTPINQLSRHLKCDTLIESSTSSGIIPIENLQYVEKYINDHLNNNAFKQFISDIVKLDKSQLTNLSVSLLNIGRWYRGGFMGRDDLGNIIEINESNLLEFDDYSAMISLMAYLIKHCIPDVARGFSKLYRIQWIGGEREEFESGDVIEIYPRKSITSWTTIGKLKSISGRETSTTDYLIMTEASKQRVLWSYKFTNHNGDWVAAIDALRSISEFTGDNNQELLYYIIKKMEHVAQNMIDYNSEKEVILYNGGKPFEATVVKYAG